MDTDALATNRSSRLRADVCLVALLLSAIAFVAVPLYQLIVPGPFEWHVQTSRFWQGGLEALVLAALIAAGFAADRRIAWLGLIAVPAAFYLRRHAVDVPLLIDLAYLEIIIGLGMAVRRALRQEPARTGEDYLQAFVLGFLAWSLAAWTLSASGLGSIVQLRWLTLLAAVVACFGRTAPFTLFAWRRLRRQERATRLWCGVLAAWLLVLFARSNVVVGYDPLWYGLRAEQVLVSGHSLFEPLGLVSPVHYFPKLYEAFLLPVSRLHDFSVIDGVTILLLPLILLACLALMRRIAVPRHAHWPALALVATVPALANTAIGPKPDVISTLFVLLAALAALDWLARRSWAAALWMLACAGLACLAKLTAIPYAAALVLATLACAWRSPAPTDGAAPSRDATRTAAIALAATLLVGGLVTARTWLLTGMPTIGPDPLVSLWRDFGMELREPAGTLRWAYPARWSELPAVVFDVLWRPQHDLQHMVITWIGNAWLWLALVALLARFASGRRMSRRTDAARLPLLALIAAGLYVFFGVGTGVRGSDGNYFLFALVPAIVVTAGAAFGRLEAQPRLLAAALACLPAFVAFQASYAFASAGWSAGTLAFDGRLNRTWQDLPLRKRQALDSTGLSRIAEYLAELPGSPRVVGSTAHSAGRWLAARYESIPQIALARPQYFESSLAFRRFLAAQHIQYLILPLPDEQESTQHFEMVPDVVVAAAAQLQALPGCRRVDDRRYYLLDFSRVPRTLVDGEAP
jgi:hypothetical protein